jgi:hypothetical protein
MKEEKLPLGPYNRNADLSTSWYSVDEHNMVVTGSNNKGLGDSIGRTKRMYFIYDDQNLISGIENCWQYREEYGGKMAGVRHPDYEEPEDLPVFHLGKKVSRDHLINTLVALSIWEGRSLYKSKKKEQIIKAIPFKIRNQARFTLGLVLWSKALLGNKVALWFYLMIEILMINLIYHPMKKLGYKLTGWKPEVDQDEWDWPPGLNWQRDRDDEWKRTHLLQQQPKWHRTVSKIVYPAYAIGFSSWQVYVIPNTFPKLKKRLQKSLLKMVGDTNYVQRMLLGDTDIPREKVEEFKTMRGGRWSGELNGRNDRHMEIFAEGRYTENLVDRDLVRELYNRTQLGQ